MDVHIRKAQQVNKSNDIGGKAALLATAAPVDLSTEDTIPPVGDTAVPPNKHRPQRHYRSRGRQFRHGQRVAVRKALTAAVLRLGIPFQRPSSAHKASEQCGANPVYTAAMITLLKAEDEYALNQVLCGSWPLLETAARLQPRASLVAAFRKTSSSDHAALGRVAGPDVMWDQCIAPII